MHSKIEQKDSRMSRKRKTSPLDIGEVLECTICLDVPASPIHNCSEGHIICGICKDKVQKCGLCQSKLQISVLAERLSRQYDLKTKCPNYEAGCRAPIAATEIKDHLAQKCYYKNVVCNETNTEVCNNVSIPLGDFVQHLKDQHKYTQENIAQRYFEANQIDHSGGMSWPMKIATKSGQWFLMHSWIHQGVAHFLTTILADKEESLKHMCELTLEPLSGDNKTMNKCIWTLPVLPYHDYQKCKYPTNMPTTTIPLEFLKEYTKKGEAETMRYAFKMSYRIL